MSQATYPLKLPASIKVAAARLTKEDGASLNRWIATAVAQKIGVAETAAAFFRRRAGNATPVHLERVHGKCRMCPTPEDEIAPDLADRLSRSG